METGLGILPSFRSVRLFSPSSSLPRREADLVPSFSLLVLFRMTDWIHDQIKDSSRVRRLHSAARRSNRGKIALFLDRSQGWIIVTIVGILTAMVAFLIVRGESSTYLGPRTKDERGGRRGADRISIGRGSGESWLFDLKDGYCAKEGGGGWRLSRGFCCRGVEGIVGEVDEQVWGRTSWVASR